MCKHCKESDTDDVPCEKFEEYVRKVTKKYILQKFSEYCKSISYEEGIED